MQLCVSRSFATRSVFAAACIFAAAATTNADVISYSAILDGPSEAPPNASPGTGFADVTIDTVARTMQIHAMFSGLIGQTTAAHIHAATAVPFAGTAGVATQTPSFSGFPLGVTSGTFDNTFDMTLASSFNPSYITNNGGTPASAASALFAAINDGKAYFNIHSSQFPGGEIRGFFRIVPAPGALGLMAFGGLCAIRRRR